MNDDQNFSVLRSALFFIIVLIIGTFGYRFIEGDTWSFLDAFYMTLITVTTIGYGETHELSTGGRVFTILVIILGIGAAATAATQFAGMILENHLTNVFGRRKMNKKIQNLKDHYIICGYSRIGNPICNQLRDFDIPFVVIESDNELLLQAERLHCLTINTDFHTE